MRNLNRFKYVVKRGTPGNGYESETLYAWNMEDAWVIVTNRKTVHTIVFAYRVGEDYV